MFLSKFYGRVLRFGNLLDKTDRIKGEKFRTKVFG